MVGHWFDTIIFLVLENHGWSQVQGCSFIQEFAAKGIVCANWFGVAHPSGPNYRAMLSGQTWSGNEFDNVNRDNVSKHVDYLVYDFREPPAARHDPFSDLNPGTAKPHASGFNENAPLAPITYLGMDDDNNWHSGSQQQAERNVSDAIAIFDKIQAKDGRLLFMVTTDEGFGDDYASNHVFTGFMGYGVEVGKTIHASLSHYNFARFLADNWDVALPPEADPSCAVHAGQSIISLP